MVRKKNEKGIVKGLSMLNPLIFVLFFWGCSDNFEQTLIQSKEKTIIFYVVADNSLINYSDTLFCNIQDYCTGNTLQNSNIIVFLDNCVETSLYQTTNTGLQKVTEYDKINSVSPQNMQNILHYIYEKYPAQETGLILWSHGTGWLPTGNKTRSFGDDNGEAIDIDDLSTSICKKLDYIIFDACYMGCVEVITELSDKADYFITSPDIVPPEGVIDTLSINILVGKDPLEDRLKSVCEHYTKEKYDKENPPIALVKSSELDNLIQLCSKMSIIDFNEEVYCYRYRTNDIFYDLGSFLNSIDNNQSLDIIDNFIVFHTDCKPGIVCLSIFLPNENNRHYHEYYSIAKWNIMTNWLCKFGYNESFF